MPHYLLSWDTGTLGSMMATEPGDIGSEATQRAESLGVAANVVDAATAVVVGRVARKAGTWVYAPADPATLPTTTEEPLWPL